MDRGGGEKRGRGVRGVTITKQTNAGLGIVIEESEAQKKKKNERDEQQAENIRN